MEPFATSEDLSNRWPIAYKSEEARDRATELLRAASRLVRNRVPGIDGRTDLDAELVTDIVCEMVWIALSAPKPGATQVSQSVGGVSLSTSFEEAAGRLRLTSAMLVLLKPVRKGGRASSTSNLPPVSGRTAGAEAQSPHWSPY